MIPLRRDGHRPDGPEEPTVAAGPFAGGALAGGSFARGALAGGPGALPGGRGALPGVIAVVGALVVLPGCELPRGEEILDLPAAAVAALDGVARVPDAVLPLGAGRVDRVAVAFEGERIFGAVRGAAAGEAYLVEWLWDEEAGRWSESRPLSFSGAGWEDGGVALAPDGSYLLFSSARPTGRAGMEGHSIWVSRWQEGGEPGEEPGWTDPWLLPDVHSPAWDGAPTLALTGNLYFASERAEGGGGRNLYFSQLEGARWSEPEALPEPVNSPADETDPWIAPDESFLLFASNRAGRWDLYVSFAGEGGEGWHDPVPLAAPVRSGGDERAPTLTLGGGVLFFVRGDGELWWAPSAAGGAVRPD